MCLSAGCDSPSIRARQAGGGGKRAPCASHAWLPISASPCSSAASPDALFLSGSQSPRDSWLVWRHSRCRQAPPVPRVPYRFICRSLGASGAPGAEDGLLSSTCLSLRCPCPLPTPASVPAPALLTSLSRRDPRVLPGSRRVRRLARGLEVLGAGGGLSF